MTAPDSRDSVERVVAEMRDTNTSVMLGGRADYPRNLIAEWAHRLQALARGPQQAGGEAAVVDIEVMRDVFDSMPTAQAKIAYAAVKTYIDCCNAIAGKPSPFDVLRDAALNGGQDDA